MKQILTSKILRKLLVLSCLSVGVIIVSGYRRSVSAASVDCYQQFSWCYGAAYDSREFCYYQCSGIIACESGCDSQYNSAVTQCDADYEACVSD